MMRWQEIQERGLSLSRLEERPPRHYLGAQGADPQNDPRERWADEPTAAEMAEMDRDERCAA